jgi:hypothetical protein
MGSYRNGAPKGTPQFGNDLLTAAGLRRDSMFDALRHPMLPLLEDQEVQMSFWHP